MNFRYPIFLDLSGKKCLVVGEGPEIAAKVRNLVDAAAKVTYVNLRAEPAIEALAAAGLISWARRDFERHDLDGCFLAIADRQDNADIFRFAEERQVLMNAVDDPEHCRFSFGSVLRQGDLTVAISTNGVAPALAVRLRERLEREIGPEYQEFLQMLREVRGEIGSRITDFDARRALWYRIVDSDILDKLREGRRDEAGRVLRQMIKLALRASARERPKPHLA
jgi:precorrin-2 dehydrogenase / sirohydrochlorin ferrochelatase